MKIIIHWQPELPGFRSSTRDEDGLRGLFGDAEGHRILNAIGVANGEPVTLRVSGHDAGYLDLDFVDAEFRVLVDSPQKDGFGPRLGVVDQATGHRYRQPGPIVARTKPRTSSSVAE